MTEDEAKMKWCPLARDSNTSGNRMQYGGDGEPADPDYCRETAVLFPCIGSECMAWRWTVTPGQARADTASRRATHPDAEEGVTDGFCGLAGRPE